MGVHSDIVAALVEQFKPVFTVSMPMEIEDRLIFTGIGGQRRIMRKIKIHTLVFEARRESNIDNITTFRNGFQLVISIMVTDDPMDFSVELPNTSTTLCICTRQIAVAEKVDFIVLPHDTVMQSYDLLVHFAGIRITPRFIEKLFIVAKMPI